LALGLLPVQDEQPPCRGIRKADLPGCEAENIDVRLTGWRLTIKNEKRMSRKMETSNARNAKQKAETAIIGISDENIPKK
jgi:hypothetical protein